MKCSNFFSPLAAHAIEHDDRENDKWVTKTTLLELTEIETVVFDSKRCSLCVSDWAGVDEFRYLQAHIWLCSNLNSNEVIDSVCVRTRVKLGGLYKVNCCLNHAEVAARPTYNVVCSHLGNMAVPITGIAGSLEIKCSTVLTPEIYSSWQFYGPP